MKQKILSAILVSAIILSMTGCGGAQPAEILDSKPSQESEVTTQTTSATTTEKQEQTESETTITITVETTTTELVEEETPKEIKSIKKYQSFRNGTLLFEIDNTGYVYDILENKMYDYDSKELATVQCACGKLVMTYNNGKYIITNLETMETYDAEPLYYESPYSYSSYYSLEAYNPVYSVKEDFDGNVYSFGILNSNGEWVLPMSSDYPVCDWLKSSDPYVYVMTPSLVSLAGGCYNYKTDEIIKFDNQGICYIMGNHVLLRDYGYPDVDYFVYNIYNIETSETTKLDGEYYNTYQRADCIILEYVDEDKYTIIDSEGNVLDYDLSEYNVRKILDATKDCIVFSAENADRDIYTLILDKNGKRIVDPIKGDRSAEYMHIYGDYVIYAQGYGEGFVADCKTGKMKTYFDDNFRLEEFDSTSGKLLMKSDDNYYLADPSDPETLINPFEIAEVQ